MDIYEELEKIGFTAKDKKKKVRQRKMKRKTGGIKKRKIKKKNKPKRIILNIILLAIVFAILIIGYVLNLYRSLPDLEKFGERIISQTTKIYDRTGEVLLYEIHGDEKRTIVPLEKIPKYTQQAVISIEDAEFYQHPAFDWRAMIRALIKNISSGRISQGGSTITQQLAKNAFLTPEKTITRKIKDILLAIKLEKRYGKDEILELYLNQISFGSNLYGLESASQAFFAKSISDITISESAILAAIIQLPTYYSPYGNHIDELFERKDFILERMEEYGYIDSQQLITAQNEEIEFQPKLTNIKAPHFVMFIREYLEEKYGASFIETAGLKIITTLDWDMQLIGEEAVLEGAMRNEDLYGGKNAALIAQDPKTGQILAMVGSRDYFDLENDGNFNVITAHRQPGSSFKPFAYLAAFEKGYSPDTVVFDLRTDFNATGIGSMKYEPENFDHQFRGPVDFRHALAQSVNVPAVKVLYLSGLTNTISLAKKLGITTLNKISDYGLSLVLGGGDVRPIDMAEAYSVFANDGQKPRQQAILKIEDSNGNVLEEYKDEKEQVIDVQYIRLLNDVLSDNEARIGLFQRNNLLTIPGYQIAAKTGTTQDYRDAWVFGYTPSLVVGVWAGNNDFSPMHEGGGSILAAVPTWNSFMTKVLPKYQPETFQKPDEIISENDDSTPMMNGQYLAYFKVGDVLYPQIHNILFWKDKESSQFENWEKPVEEWIKDNFSNWQEFNQPVPDGYSEVITGQDLEVRITSPKSGVFIESGNMINILAEINSVTGIRVAEIYFNNQLIKFVSGENNNGDNGASIIQISHSFVPQRLDPQNEIKIVVKDDLGNEAEEKLIVFSK